MSIHSTCHLHSSSSCHCNNCCPSYFLCCSIYDYLFTPREYAQKI
uniref:Uncharacterized protein n=1 Tax=Rhizophora mucronata TaxID=61149 RepID=A0A2P2LSU7_RHIMU